ncbi:MAG: T9SS type A sorting domain-containing protein [Sphingobacteriaceae bacterium]|nr:T9SS type A sorting domain-containing protein [Sphingobacteriaceae bacterium]
MKIFNKTYISFILLLSLFFLAAFTIKKSSGAHPGSTGAPDDETCAQVGCHADAMVITNAVNNNTLIFSTPDSSYFPGQVYTLTVQVQGSGLNPVTKFGFELQPIKDADSTHAGQFSLLQPTRTQIINHLMNGDTRYSVTHTETGNIPVSTNLNQWIINWTAPPTNVGKITFYYATNCANDNGQNTGDRIYLHSFQIHPNPAVGINEEELTHHMFAFYDNSTKNIIVDYKLAEKSETEIKVFDVSGKLIYSTSKENTQGTQKISIPAGNEFSSGNYIIQLNVNGSVTNKKIIINK